jgi:Holliday junction resolvase
MPAKTIAEKEYQKTWKLIQEVAIELRETKEMIETMSRETDKKIGALTGKWSRFVEGLIAPAALKLFTERGIAVNTIYQRVRKQLNGDGIEIDILAINGEYAILIEAKSTLGVDDIKEHLERLEKFAKFFPEYAARKVVGAVAGIAIDEGADKFAYRNGLFVIAQSGETVKILNDEKFTPQIW